MFVARRDHTATLLPDGRVLATGGRNANPSGNSELYNPLTRTWATSGGFTQARSQHTATLLPNGKVLMAGGLTTTSSTASAHLYDVTTGTWTATGSLVQPRHLHTATLLQNGKVLVVGGLSTATPWAQAELYDPATGAWTAAGTLATARYEHTATLLPDGRVLVAGGRNTGGAVSSAELYNPTTGTWTSASSLPGPRTQHTATLLPGGKVFVVGGFNGSAGLSTNAEYDPATNTWTLRADLTQARYNHSATLLPGGQVLVMGGQDAFGDLASSVLYNPATNTWTAAGPLSRTSRSHTTTLLASGQVLLVGGLQGSTTVPSAEVYTAFDDLGSWSNTGTMAQVHYGHTATLLGNGRVLITGGQGTTTTPLSTTEAYDFTTGTWASRAPMAQPRYLHSASLLQSGKVLVAGGYNTSSARTNTAELYDPAANTWASTGVLAQVRSSHVAVVLQSGRVLVTGGYNTSTVLLAAAEQYNPATGTWSSASTMLSARSNHTATALADGRVLVAGGETASSTLLAAEVYDPATNTWASTGAMLSPREGHTATLLPTGEVLVTGGFNGTVYLSQAELYNPATGTWSSAGTMSATRYQHTATLLPSGHVLLMGGSGSNDVDLYNPYTGQWTFGGVLPSGTGIYGQSTTLLPDGTVLLAGGENTSARTTVSRLYTPHDALKSWYPFISSVSPSNTVPAGTAVTLSGLRFRGMSEAGGGTALSSATDVPLVTLYSPQDESLRALLPGTFSGTALTVTLPSGLTGPHLLFLTTNAISTGQMLILGGAPPPDTTVSAAPPAQTNSRSASFSFSSTTSTATFECSLDGGAFITCASPRTYSSLTDGTHTFLVRAKDGLGGVDTTPASYTWLVDATPPQTSITASPASPTSATSATFSFTADDAQATFECSVDGTAFSPCTSPSTYTGLTHGSHTFQVRARDVLTNVDATPASHSWTVDTAPPDTTITTAPPATSTDTTATFSFTGTETGATFECSLDGAAFATCTPPRTLTGLMDGTHTFQVRAKDTAGNVDPTPASHSWTVDSSTPETAITSAPPAVTSTTSATFTFTSNVAGATFECNLDGAAFSACSSPITFTLLSDATHIFLVRAKKANGNADPSPASYTWTVDTFPPNTFIASAPPEFSNSSSATFSFSSDEGNVFYECSLDGASFSPCLNPTTYSSLSNSAHTFRVRAKDVAGNVDASPTSYTWTVDTSAPDTLLSTTPPLYTQDRTASFTFSSNEAGITFECSLNGVAFSACASPTSYSALAEGTHTFQVRARRSNGIVDPTPASHTWTVDTVVPNTSLTSAPPASATSSTATFTFTSNEAGAFFECNLDGTGFTACSSPATYTSLANGAHTFQVRARDSAGNVDATPASHAWNIDSSVPETVLSAAPPVLTTQKTASFTFSSPDTGVTFECSLDGAAFSACTSPMSYSSLAEGSHTFQVRARKANGNTDPTPASHTWTVDSLVPETTLTSAPPVSATSSSASFSFSSNETGVIFECSLDGVAFSACTSPMTYSSLANGSHTFQVRARDSVGNVDATPASHSWTVDTATPETVLSATPPALTTQKTASFSFSSPDTGVTFECSLDGASFGPCTSPMSYSSLAEGSHTFQVRARKANGNTDPTPASHTWTVDSLVPETTLTSAPPALATSSSASFSFTSNETGVIFECSLDGAAFSACTSPTTYTVSEGSHTFQVRARDSVGNVDATPASHSWTVNVTPETSITSAPAALVSASAASFTFSSSEAGVTFECSLDGAAFTACTSPRSYLSLAEGLHTFQVRAKDAFSVDPTPASHTWTVDTVAPSTVLTVTPPATSTSPQASFSFSSNETGSTFECSLDGTGFTACTSPYTSTSLADGSHTFSVRARDGAGNVDATPASYSWMVDAGPPDTTLTSKPPALTNATSASFTFTSNEAGATFECSLDGAAFSACVSPVTYSALGAGNHTFVVRARDSAGQRDASPPSHLWSIDATAPDTTLTSVPPVLSSSTSASFVFASPKSGVTFECSLDGVAFSACASPTAYASLPEGAHTFQVRARDGAGNVDISPASHTWTVDTTAPGVPVLVAPARGATVTTAFPEFSGTAEPGSMVSVAIDGNAVGTAQVDSAGNWLLTPPAPLGEGQHGVSLSAKDKAGNTSAATTSTFTVKTGQTGPEEPEPEQPGGCGCASTAPLSAWPWAVLVLGLVLSRRRASGGGAS
jgi:uncharacterized protein (TIGR03382 family)